MKVEVTNEMYKRFSEITKFKVVQNLDTNMNGVIMSTVVKLLSKDMLKMDLDRCTNSQKVHQNSMIVLISI